jgi:hypothetical protein
MESIEISIEFSIFKEGEEFHFLFPLENFHKED